MRCRIMGFFWLNEGSCEIIRDFAGYVVVDELGKKFSGTTKDQYGEANINGEFKENEIVFLKEYNSEAKTRSATLFPVNFTFYPFIVNGVVMGWQGFWEIKGGNHRKGRATCLMFPAPLV